MADHSYSKQKKCAHKSKLPVHLLAFNALRLRVSI